MLDYDLQEAASSSSYISTNREKNSDKVDEKVTEVDRCEDEDTLVSRAPLVKMRTSVENRKKDLNRSIDRQSHHNSVGGHVEFEQ